MPTGQGREWPASELYSDLMAGKLKAGGKSRLVPPITTPNEGCFDEKGQLVKHPEERRPVRTQPLRRVARR